MCITKIIALTVVILASGIDAGVINRMFNPLSTATEEYITPCRTTFELKTEPTAMSAFYPNETVHLHPGFDQFQVGSCTHASPRFNLPGRCKTVPHKHQTWVVRQRDGPRNNPRFCTTMDKFPDLVRCKELVVLPGACTLKIPASFKSKC